MNTGVRYDRSMVFEAVNRMAAEYKLCRKQKARRRMRLTALQLIGRLE